MRSLADVPRPLLLLALMLISGGGVVRPAIARDASPPTAARVAPAQDPLLLAQAATAADLERLSTEADLAFRRATTLFFVMLGTLLLLLGLGVVMLWLMRRSVIQEVSVVVRNQINDITDLETKIQTATRDLDYILAQAKERAAELDSRTDRFQEEAVTKKQVLNRLVDDLAEFKARTINDWQSTLSDLQVKLESTEANFVGHLTGLRQTADDEITTLRKDTQLQRDVVFRTLEENQTGFLRDVNRLRSDVEVHQDAVLADCDVVVSHAGSGTVLGALRHGLPTVSLPMGADQHLNAQRLHRLGLGLSLAADRVGAPEVQAAVDEVLHSASVGSAAREVRDEIRSLPPLAHAVADVLRLADRAGGPAA